MSKYLYWRYTNTTNTRVGSMVCCSCKKSITEGDFRHYQNGREEFIVQHRQCGDKRAWEKHDLEEKNKMDYQHAFEADCIAFAKKWNLSLDDLLEVPSA